MASCCCWRISYNSGLLSKQSIVPMSRESSSFSGHCYRLSLASIKLGKFGMRCGWLRGQSFTEMFISEDLLVHIQSKHYNHVIFENSASPGSRGKIWPLQDLAGD